MTLFRRWRVREGAIASSLRDLEGRTNGVGFLAGGAYSGDGDNATTAFTIPHNLEKTPTLVSVTAKSADADGDFYVTVDATNLTVTFGTAPVTGTGNVELWWAAGFTGA